MMKRCLSLLLVVGLIAVLAVPVSADEGQSSAWIELLETSSVTSNGENWFIINGKTGAFTIPLHTEKRLAKIDVLIWHQSAERISTASVTVGSLTKQLTVVYVGQNVSRVYGAIPNAFYENVTVNFTKSTTTNCVWEVLSCRVTPFEMTEFNVDATVWMEYNAGNSFKTPGYCDMPNGNFAGNYAATTPINVHDWEKYDSVTVFGSLSQVGLVSVRAIVGNVSLPFEISYTSSLPTDVYSNEYTWTEYKTYYGDPDGGIYDESGRAVTDTTGFSYYQYGGTTLYSITVDLTGIDRTKGATSDLQIHFTYIAMGDLGYRFNVAGASGAIYAADTSEVTWWNRFTSFMTDLFGDKDPGALDDLGDSSNSISSNTDQIHGFEQSQQAVLDNNFAQIQTAVTFTNFAAALVFVQKYANMTFSSISGYAIVFTLPLFLGLFFYLCSRIPGITRWKTPPPRSKPKGGGKP